VIAVECPQCGAPTPAFPLAPERLTCRACRYVGAPSLPVLEQLRAAAHHLGAANAHHARHLSVKRAAAFHSIITNGNRLRRIGFFLIFPFVLVATCSVAAATDERPQYGLAVFFGLPLVVLAVTSAFASRLLRRQQREMAETVAAIPPATAGEPAQCHLCGAGLPPVTSASPISRCLHCGTDNVASREVLHTVLRRRQRVVENVQHELARRAAFMGRSGSSAVTLVVVLSLVAPFVGFGLAVALNISLDRYELDDVRSEYVLVQIEGDVCSAFVESAAKDGKLVLKTALGGRTRTTFHPKVPPPRLKESWFIGRQVKTGPGDATIRGKVTRIYTHVLSPETNHARMLREGGRTYGTSLDQLCLVETPAEITPLVWPDGEVQP
jgi:hypothetical protein